MRYFISSNLPMNWEKYVFHWQKWDFELILNSLHIAELLALYYVSRPHVKPKVQVYIQQWWMPLLNEF